MARKKKIDPNEVLATIRPQPARRAFAVGAMVTLGAIVLSIAVLRPPEFFYEMLFLVFFGAVCLWLAYSIWRATSATLELTRSELREISGRTLCSLDNVERVDRGAFAFKPAGGFLVKLKQPVGFVYAPGLWFRAGRTLAVGGATGRQDGKNAADMMIVMLVERGQDI